MKLLARVLGRRLTMELLGRRLRAFKFKAPQVLLLKPLTHGVSRVTARLQHAVWLSDPQGRHA
jgi:hypothetical protein